jgi:hypothetical protein
MDPLATALVFLPKSPVRAATKLGVSALPHQTGTENHMRYSEQRLWTKEEKGKFGSSNVSVRRQEDRILYQLNILFSTKNKPFEL